MTVSKILHRRLFPRNASWLAAYSYHSRPFAPQLLACRSFATSGKSSDNNNNGIILYERNPEANLAPRLGLGVTFVHSLYWCWYVLDFIPAVNASPITELHIHPLWGKVPCTVAVAVNIAGCVYATRMVSKIVWKNDTSSSADRSIPPLEIYFHTLPFMMPSTKPTHYGVGEVALNPQSTEVTNLKNMLLKSPSTLQQSSLSFTPGHFPLEAANQQFGKVPLGFYMTRLDDVKNPKLFLDVLLFANAPQLKPASSSKKQQQQQQQAIRGNNRKSSNKKSKQQRSTR